MTPTDTITVQVLPAYALREAPGTAVRLEGHGLGAEAAWVSERGVPYLVVAVDAGRVYAYDSTAGYYRQCCSPKVEALALAAVGA